MAEILVAASEPAREPCAKILAGHKLVFVHTIKEALQQLRRNHFDLILCTMIFDESRMLDFLSKVKANEQWQRIPFICFRCVHAKLEVANPALIESAKSASAGLGAAAFLNIDNYDNFEEIRTEIEKHLPNLPSAT